MKIQISTRVSYGDAKEGKRYKLSAGIHEVPAHVGEYLVKRGHAKAVEIEAPVAEPVKPKAEPVKPKADAKAAPKADATKSGDAPKADAGGDSPKA